MWPKLQTLTLRSVVCCSHLVHAFLLQAEKKYTDSLEGAKPMKKRSMCSYVSLSLCVCVCVCTRACAYVTLQTPLAEVGFAVSNARPKILKLPKNPFQEQEGVFTYGFPLGFLYLEANDTRELNLLDSDKGMDLRREFSLALALALALSLICRLMYVHRYIQMYVCMYAWRPS